MSSTADIAATSSPAPSKSGGHNFDPLLRCLTRICKFHHLHFNEHSASAGLPMEAGSRLNPACLLRAARRCGLQGKVVKRKIKAISADVTPALLLLKNGGAAVIESRGDSDKSSRLYLAVEDGEEEIELAHLKKEYTGYAIFFQPLSKVDEDDTAVRPEFDGVEARRWWFWRTMWRFRGYYSQLLPGSLLINLFAVAMPFFIMIVYDRVVPNDAVETLWVLAIGAGIVFTFEYMIRLVRGTILERAGKEIDQILASLLFEQVLSIEMKARPSSAGVMTGRLKAYETLREFFMSASMLALTDLPFGLLMVLVIFYIGGPIGWILVVATLLAIAVELLIQGPLRRAVTNSVSSGIQRQAFISETITAMETVKGCNAEGILQHRLERMMKEGSISEVRSHWYGLLGNSTTSFLIHLTTISVVVFSVYRVHAGDMTMGAMIACVMLAARCMAPVSMVTSLMTRMQYAIEALRGLNTIMEMRRETGDGRDFIRTGKIRNQFTLRSVKARYPDQVQPALNNVSFDVSPGEKIAVLGRIGSGKSTLLRILSKLYEPEEGEVLLDGVELAQYHPTAVRSLVGYLPQDAALFEGTLRENLLLGYPESDDVTIFRALKLASLDEMVQRHPKGIHMPVGERGSLLSGGQRQAVALARALVAEPDMLLLDEPTASMDNHSERQVKTAIMTYLEADPARSLVLVTHKLSMLDIVDRAVVIEQGKVVADGPRETILAKMRQGKVANGSQSVPIRETPELAV